MHIMQHNHISINNTLINKYRIEDNAMGQRDVEFPLAL